MFTQEALRAALISVLTENQKIALDEQVGEAILVHRAYFLVSLVFVTLKCI